MSTTLLYDFLTKLAADERRLRNIHAQITQTIYATSGVPAAVIYNYEVLASKIQSGMDFAVELQRKYADPHMATQTPTPIPLPRFRLKGVTLSVTLSGEPVPLTTVLGPLNVVPLLVPACPVPPEPPPAPPGLGVVPAVIWWGIAIGGVLLAAGAAGKWIIDSWRDVEARVAQDHKEERRLKSFDAIWQSAAGAYYTCMKGQSGAAISQQCWQSTYGQVPAIAQALPATSPYQPPPSGWGVFSWLGSLLVIGGVVVGGVALYRWNKKRPPHARTLSPRKYA